MSKPQWPWTKETLAIALSKVGVEADIKVDPPKKDRDVPLDCPVCKFEKDTICPLCIDKITKEVIAKDTLDKGCAILKILGRFPDKDSAWASYYLNKAYWNAVEKLDDYPTWEEVLIGEFGFKKEEL